MPKVWKYLASTCCYASSSSETMAFSWLGARFHWPNSSSIVKGTPICFGCYRLFHQVSEAVPLKNMTHKEVIEFITEHIIHKFGIPQTLTTDQGTSFISKEVRDFAESYKIKMLNSSPYYAQANGQAESSNKILIKLIKKKIEDNQKGGMRSYPRLYGLIVYQGMELLKLLLLSLYMVKKLCCLSK